MGFKIKTFQNEEGIFAEVLTDEGNNVCTGDGDTPYEAIKEACLALADIMTIADIEEKKRLADTIKRRQEEDDGVRYSLEDVKKMFN